MAEAATPVEVFCCYSHADEKWLRKLEIHLSLLKRQDLISLWSTLFFRASRPCLSSLYDAEFFLDQYTGVAKYVLQNAWLWLLHDRSGLFQ